MASFHTGNFFSLSKQTASLREGLFIFYPFIPRQISVSQICLLFYAMWQYIMFLQD